MKPQLERGGKANMFLDNRLGENNERLTNEEKALKRLQKELKKKKNIYNLEDEGPSETLTHHGTQIDNLATGLFDCYYIIIFLFFWFNFFWFY
jgi:hypothetical protein